MAITPETVDIAAAGLWYASKAEHGSMSVTFSAVGRVLGVSGPAITHHRKTVVELRSGAAREIVAEHGSPRGIAAATMSPKQMAQTEATVYLQRVGQ